jgi:hypothetical protein
MILGVQAPLVVTRTDARVMHLRPLDDSADDPNGSEASNANAQNVRHSYNNVAELRQFRGASPHIYHAPLRPIFHPLER